MKSKLFVDDWRNAPAGWVLARTVEEALQVLRTGEVEEVSLDYMIGEDPDHNFEPVARFIAQMPREKRPKRVLIHTSSGRGAWALERLLSGQVEEVIRV